MELLGQRVGICLPLEELAKLFSKVAFPLAFLPTKYEFQLFHILVRFFFQFFAFFFKFSPSDGCSDTSLWWYRISLMSNHVLFVHLYVFPDEVSAEVFFSFYWVICLLLNANQLTNL